MHLLAALIAGVRGAESGTVEIYRRGTSDRATWYSSFEGAGANSTGDDIDLDSNGGVEVYVNEPVHCIVKDTAGLTVREFTAAYSASAIEVRSQSFTGTNYNDGTTGAGSNYPLTLARVLDLLFTTNAAIDWLVRVGDTTQSLPDWLGALEGLFYNVKAYGAVGDGATDDTAACQAAMTAAGDAGGGVVYFPAGSYRTSAALTLPVNVSVLGAGAQASAILINHATANAILTTGGASYDGAVIRGLRVAPSVASTGDMISVAASTKLSVRDCYLGGENANGNLIDVASSISSRLLVDGSVFEIGTASTAAAVNIAGTIQRFHLSGCRFQTPETYTPANATVYAGQGILTDCWFDNSASTGGTIVCVKPNSTTLALQASGCVFLASSGADVTAFDLGTYVGGTFREVNSTFGADVTAYDYTVGATGADVQLVTRRTRIFSDTDNTVTLTVPVSQYGIINLRRTTAGNQVFSPDGDVPEGEGGVVYVHNDSGAGAIAAEGPDVPFFPAATDAVSDGDAHAWRYTSLTINGNLRLFVDYETTFASVP